MADYKLLEKLIDFMETVPDEKFNFSTWSNDGADPNECGSQACALGWATTIPEMGLRFVHDPIAGAGVEHVASGESGVDAARAAFGLDRIQARILFLLGPTGGLSGDFTAKAWAKWARALVKTWKRREVRP